MECWKKGTMEDWNFGILEYWKTDNGNVGMMEYWKPGILEKWKIVMFFSIIPTSHHPIVPLANFFHQSILPSFRLLFLYSIIPSFPLFRFEGIFPTSLLLFLLERFYQIDQTIFHFKVKAV